MNYERGWLGTPAMTRLLNRLAPEVDAAIQADADDLHTQVEDPDFTEEREARAIKERNEETYLRGIRSWFDKQEVNS